MVKSLPAMQETWVQSLVMKIPWRRESGDYNDLTNKPTIPAVNDGVLTIAVNGTPAGTFSANQAGNSTIDIPAPSVQAFATNAEIDALTAEWHL